MSRWILTFEDEKFGAISPLTTFEAIEIDEEGKKRVYNYADIDLSISEDGMTFVGHVENEDQAFEIDIRVSQQDIMNEVSQAVRQNPEVLGQVLAAIRKK